MNQHLSFFTFLPLSENVKVRCMAELLYVIVSLPLQSSGIAQAVLPPVHGGSDNGINTAMSMPWAGWFCRCASIRPFLVGLEGVWEEEKRIPKVLMPDGAW